MDKRKIITILTISILCLESLYFFWIPFGNVKGSIPPIYSQKLNLTDNSIYNVTQFTNKFTWLDLNWAPRGDAITNPGGQIKVNFTGFYDKDPSAAGKSAFPDPIPHINITFFENQSGSLITNSTFNNVSNSEAGLSLAIGYNAFHSGFLIQINNLATLKQIAEDQVLASGFMPGDLQYVEYDYMVKFAFYQDNKDQNSTMIYDKDTGILVLSKVQSAFGPDLEIFLVGYELNYQITNPKDNIPLIYSFQLIIIMISLSVMSIIIILKINIKKLK